MVRAVLGGVARLGPGFAVSWLVVVMAGGWLATFMGGPGQAAEETSEEPVEVLVVLRNGQRFAGILVEDSEERVVLRAAGAPVRLAREEIASVTRLPPVMERYEKLRAGIADDDLPMRLKLVEWLLERDKVQVASDELDDLLSRDPDYLAARQLRRELDARIELERRAAARRAERERERRAQEERGLARDEQLPRLTREQINLIRVYEVDLDNPPLLRIEQETIDKLMQRYANSPLIPATHDGREELYSAPRVEILELMFRLRARDLYGEVEVLADPESMRLFRSRVHGAWLMNACATNACHGGAEAGRLQLMNRRRHRDETVYTNFLILERFELSDGTPLINYSDPVRSPLLHLGLARDESLYPHPPVESPRGVGDRWRWVFRTTEDRHFLEAVEWITSMYTPRPEYPIEYPPPGPRAAAEGEELGGGPPQEGGGG